MRRLRRIAASTLLASVVAVAGYARLGTDRPGADRTDRSAAAPAGAAATVIRVVDGDTLRVVIDGREEAVRLIGVDTPETHGRGGLRECFGAEAARYTEQKLPPGTSIRLARDAQARDRYDRLLAYVWREADGLFINLALARDGYGAPLSIPPNVSYADEFADAATAARRANRGLWGKCGGPDTPLSE